MASVENVSTILSRQGYPVVSEEGIVEWIVEWSVTGIATAVSELVPKTVPKTVLKTVAPVAIQALTPEPWLHAAHPVGLPIE